MIDPDLATPVTSYLIFLSSASAPTSQTAQGEEPLDTVGGDRTSYSLTNLENGTTYIVGVAAQNAAGRSDITNFQFGM